MHAVFHVLPSVVETAPPALDLHPGSLIDQLVISDRRQLTLVGELALSEGRSPTRIVNATPDQRDYRILLKAGLVLALREKRGPAALGLGFPTATMRTLVEPARALLSRLESIGYDARPVGGSASERIATEIHEVAIISEITACDVALRQGPTRAAGGHFVLSLGYGTCEAALTTPTGVVQRTAISLPGIRYAVERAMQDVSRAMPLGLRTEHQFDAHFRAGRITVGRERVSLQDVRKRALEAYFENVIVPAIANTWTGEDFGRADAMYVTGGGALYNHLIDAIRTEFGGFINVQVVPDPVSLASLGYALNAANVAGSDVTSVGIDIGNASTCVCVIER